MTAKSHSKHQTPADLAKSETVTPAFADTLRVGVVDIGSNSVRLVVFDGAARSPGYFYNEKIMCQLGADMAQTGRLNPQGRVRALAAIKRFQALAARMQLGGLIAVATAAMREASDGDEFSAEIRRETGLSLRIIDGTEEARLSAQGVLLGWPGAYGLVSDIGGSSMELAEIRDGRVGKCLTSPLGPFKLRHLGSDKSSRRDKIHAMLAGMHQTLGPQHDRLFLVGGSWRAIARIDMERRNYPLHVLHEYRMTCASVAETLRFIEDNDPDAIRASTGISSTRMAMVPDAALVLEALVDTLAPHDIAVSSYGLREGLLYEQMPVALRERDPLIEACRFSEQKDARVPGFGDVLYSFVSGLFPAEDADMLRIIHAACLIHDVSWRAHPDYRAELCFDYATRANLGGLTHSERAFLGKALMNRYSRKTNVDRFEQITELLDVRERQLAIVTGRAMRLGAMLWIGAGKSPGRLIWNEQTRTLTLALDQSARDLFGEVANARLAALAQALDAAETEICIE